MSECVGARRRCTASRVVIFAEPRFVSSLFCPSTMTMMRGSRRGGVLIVCMLACPVAAAVQCSTCDILGSSNVNCSVVANLVDAGRLSCSNVQASTCEECCNFCQPGAQSANYDLFRQCNRDNVTGGAWLERNTSHNIHASWPMFFFARFVCWWTDHCGCGGACCVVAASAGLLCCCEW